jgi:hypothetical protein
MIKPLMGELKLAYDLATLVILPSGDLYVFTITNDDNGLKASPFFSVKLSETLTKIQQTSYNNQYAGALWFSGVPQMNQSVFFYECNKNERLITSL